MSKVESRFPAAPPTPPKVDGSEHKASQAPHKTNEAAARASDRYVGGSSNNKENKAAAGPAEKLPTREQAPALNKEDASGVSSFVQEFTEGPARVHVGHGPATPNVAAPNASDAPPLHAEAPSAGASATGPGAADVVTTSAVDAPAVVPVPEVTTGPSAAPGALPAGETPATPSVTPVVVPGGEAPVKPSPAPLAVSGDKATAAPGAPSGAPVVPPAATSADKKAKAGQVPSADKAKRAADAKAKGAPDAPKKAEHAPQKKGPHAGSNAAAPGGQGGAKKAGGSGGGGRAQEHKKAPAGQTSATNATRAAGPSAQASSVAKAYRSADTQAQKQAMQSWSRGYQAHHPQGSKTDQLDELRKQLLAQGLDPSAIDAAVAELSDQLDAAAPDATLVPSATQGPSTPDAMTNLGTGADVADATVVASTDDTTTS